MKKISRPRVFLAGLLGGIAIAFIEYLMDTFVSPDRWDVAAVALNKLLAIAPPTVNAASKPNTVIAIALLQVVGLAAGFAAGRFYAAFSRLRPRLLLAAITGWTVTYAPVCVVILWWKLVPAERAVSYLALFAGSSLAASLVGTALGGWIYKESEAASQRAAARATEQG